MSKLKSRWLLALLVLTLSALPLMADSQARIVRLSSIQGNVSIDKHTGDGFEKAVQNMPVMEGMRVAAGDEGRAEIEFEDGSTLRLVPNTSVEFPRLALRDSGAKVTHVELTEGTAYFNVDPGKHDEFVIDFGHRSIDLDKASRFRVSMDKSDARVAVNHGKLVVTAPGARSAEISKNESVTFDLSDNDRFEVAKNYQEGPYDQWDREQDDYQKTYASNHHYDSPYSYGQSDLNYYGNYFNAPGYGQVWRPYFASYGWDPFLDGSWNWYPGFGYTWVSAYPWGWMPYRYGNWLFVPAYGWVWQPGYWRSWNPVPRVAQAPSGWTAPVVPTTGKTPVIISRGTIMPTGPAAKFGDPTRRTVLEGADGKVIRNPQSEAGLGVPRGRADLGKMSTPPAAAPSFGQGMHNSPKMDREGEVRGRSTGPRTAPAPAPRMSGPSPRTSAPASSPRPTPHR